MKWVVVTIQSVKQSGLWAGLVSDCGIWLLVLWWWVVHGRWALWSIPVTLADEEGGAVGAGVHFSGIFINQLLLSVNNGTSLSLVVNADDSVAELEVAACGGWWEGLKEGHGALAVEDALSVEFRDAWDRDCALGGVEVNHFLGSGLEWEDDWVGWENGEFWVEFL